MLCDGTLRKEHDGYWYSAVARSFPAGWSLEWPKIALLLVTMSLLLKFKKPPESRIIPGTAIVGLVGYP